MASRLLALEAERQRTDEQVRTLADRVERLESRPQVEKPRFPEPDPNVTYSVPIDGNPSVGRADAKITIVEGYEYACFYCNKVRATLKEVRQRYGGDVRIVYKPFIVHPGAATAPALAACAAQRQGRFAEMDEALWAKVFEPRNFDGDRCWATPQGCPVVEGLARELRLNLKKFNADLRGDCPKYVEREQAVLRTLLMRATPGFFINGRWISGAQPLGKFTQVIDEELAKADQRIAAGTPKSKYYQTWIIDKGQPAGQPSALGQPSAPGQPSALAQPSAPAQLAAREQGLIRATIKTSLGELHCTLDSVRAPRTVANFVGLATGKKPWFRNNKKITGKPFYNGLIFHRAIPGFMIQGGDPEGNGTGGPGYMFANEISPELHHVAGALSMANKGPDTNGSQFFIMEVDRPELDGSYSVFGQCQELDVIRKISAVPRDAIDKPRTPVVIESITFP